MTIRWREIGAFALWVPVAVIYAFVYLQVLVQVIGTRLGLAAGAYVVALPIAMLLFAMVIWLPWFVWRRRGTGARLGLAGGLAAALLCGIALLPFCGVRCFSTGGMEAWLGEVSMAFAFIGALAHDAVSRAFLGRAAG